MIAYALEELDGRLVLLLEGETVAESAPGLRGHLVRVDELLGQVKQLADVMPGFISRFANLWPDLAMRLLQRGDDDDNEELRRRLGLLMQAGGLAAMKHHLGFGNRAPLDWLDPGPLAELPPCGAG